ncbi:MAG: HI0074 family nucleotidyltransferase substrate-binding subunit [Candidatus Binatia bacterium]
MADRTRALENLERAMAELESYAALPVTNRRDKAGLIQAFEFTFELFWKTFQKIAPDSGLEAVSPREALIAGLKLHLITDEEAGTWSQMLRDRNLSSHTYNAALADEIVERLLGSYLACFRATIERTRRIGLS